jgi:hypothetical protein
LFFGRIFPTTFCLGAGVSEVTIRRAVHFPHNDRVKIRLCITSALIFLVFPAIVSARKKSAPLAVPSHSTTGPDYVSALATANHFLQAWQAVDHEAGLLLLSDSAKHQTSAERLEKYFSPESTPQRAYQIARGTKLKGGRYTFPVTFFEQESRFSYTRNSHVIVVQTRKDDWAVDKLP